MKTKKCEANNCGRLIFLDGRSRFVLEDNREVCEDCWAKKEITGVKI